MMVRIPHYLDNRFTNAGKRVSHTQWPLFTSQKHYFSDSGTHFSGLVLPERLGK
jgi:hypothetical protein